MIDSSAFIERVNRTAKLSLPLSNILFEAVRINRFEPQETLLSPGNYASSIYFVQSGVVRGAIEGKKDKVSTWFKQEGSIIIPQGLFNEKPSDEYISPVISTTLLSIPFKHIKKLMTGHPDMIELIVLLMAEVMAESHYRIKLLRVPSAKGRYDLLSKNEDFILKRVPHNLIASYINVSNETFSHLNKGLPY
jgi:CRP-like cAMP-binding protein